MIIVTVKQDAQPSFLPEKNTTGRGRLNQSFRSRNVPFGCGLQLQEFSIQVVPPYRWAPKFCLPGESSGEAFESFMA